MKQIQYVSADEAVKVVKSHDHIHLSSVSSVPHILIEALCRRADNKEFEDVRFHHLHTEGPAPYADPKYAGIFFEQGFFIGSNVRKSVDIGYADYIPTHLCECQKLYRSGIVPCDVAMVSVSPPNAEGYVSLGTSVECSVAAIEMAKTVIAVVNKHVPFSYGDLISVDDIDIFVQHDCPLDAKQFSQPSEIETLIGKHCAELVPDGACIQMGIGTLPNAVAAQLKDHQHLGIHTEMFADGVLALIRSGVLDGSRKNIDVGKHVAAFLYGSQDVYDFIHENPSVLVKDVKYTNDPWTISRNDNVVAINSALEVDFTGQICADSIGTRLYSGTGGQVDFVRGANMSKGGKSITAFASRSAKGIGKIVPTLKVGAGVVTARSDAHWIVTEYGAVDLYGKSIQERAKLMTSIAHPDDREALDRAAYERFGPHYHNFSI